MRKEKLWTRPLRVVIRRHPIVREKWWIRRHDTHQVYMSWMRRRIRRLRRALWSVETSDDNEINQLLHFGRARKVWKEAGHDSQRGSL